MNNNIEHPLFSIIIPTYNYGDRLDAAVDSVLAQPERCEIIIVDDGSTDNTREVIAPYGNDLTYVYQDNRGVSAARNHGVSMASGDYLLFLDADDRLLPASLKIIREQVKRYPDVDCFIAGRISINGKRKVSIPGPLAELNLDNFSAFLRKKLGSVTIGAVRKSVFDTVKFPESIRNNEDIVLVAQILARFSCRSIPQPVIEVHQHADSLRHNISSVMDSTRKVVDALFNPEVLPSEFMRFKNEFSSRVLLSRFRSLYLAGDKKAARKLYHESISLYPKHIFLLGYLKKYIRCYL